MTYTQYEKDLLDDNKALRARIAELEYTEAELQGKMTHRCWRRTVWVKALYRIREGIGPGFPDVEVVSGFDVRESQFDGATAVEVTCKEWTGREIDK